jgi:N-acetylmuramoyl-L-alanine amidase
MKKAVLGWLAAFLLLLSLLSYELPLYESWSAWSLPLSGVIIVLDPGHGGVDGGAVAKNGVVEKDVTLPISFYLRDFLQEAGALVIMTREHDTDLAEGSFHNLAQRKRDDLRKRVQLVKDSQADLLVSIHTNAYPGEKWRGAQTFYHPAYKESETLAQFIQDEIVKKLENTDRLAKKIDNIYLLENIEVPGVIVEVGFLSNPEEANLLKTDDYQRKMAQAIYQGILRFYSGEKLSDAKP